MGLFDAARLHLDKFIFCANLQHICKFLCAEKTPQTREIKYPTAFKGMSIFE